jgi:hypothetical protein
VGDIETHKHDGDRVSDTSDTNEDNTTRYWNEQKARGKLQIAEELNNGLMKIKSRLLQQTLGTRYSSE